MMISTLYTCGHSDRTPEELLEMLSGAGIARLIDIRRYPASRRHPHFARQTLQASLDSAGVSYQWEGAALGGRRGGGDDGPHLGLRDASLRGFAGHMESDQFACRMREIMRMAASQPVMLMCAERQPEHCHRNLVADYLTWQGWRVMHLLDAAVMCEHRMHPCARVIAGRLIYNGGMTIPLDMP